MSANPKIEPRAGARPAHRLRVRLLPVAAVDGRTAAQWAELEQRALEPNAYLSPNLILPAARYLTPGGDVLVAVVERLRRSGSEIAALGVFEAVARSWQFPLPHLRAFRSAHSYLSGLLAESEEVDAAVHALFGFIRRETRWHGMLFHDRPGDSELDERMTAAAATAGVRWFEHERSQRAVFSPAEAGESYVARMLGKGTLKDLRRRWRRLEELGDVDWRVTPGDDEEALRRFIHLEHLGWKGEKGRSLKARRGHAAFFREMVRGFGGRRAFFTELCVAGEVIGSTVNLISADAGFAFKLGWDPAYARYSPGLLNEVELVRRAPRLWPRLRYFDSGADEGSFIERLWGGRRTLVTGVYAVSGTATRAAYCLAAARRVKRWLRAR